MEEVSENISHAVYVSIDSFGTPSLRYQFSYIPVGTTFLFVQVDHISDRGDAVAKIVGSVPDLSAVGYKSIGLGASSDYLCIQTTYSGHYVATEIVDYMETTASMACTRTAGQAPPPLWFFLLQCEGGGQALARDCNFPRAFWSSEKHPTSIPADVIFDPTPTFERIRGDTNARLSIWKQVIDGLTFTTQTKYVPVSIENLFRMSN